MANRRAHAALFVLTAAALFPACTALAGASPVEVPNYRELGAVEPLAEPGVNGTDYSADPPSLSGLSLIATIPAPSVPRAGFLIQAQCTAGLTVAFDDPAGAVTSTLVVLAGASANGAQGASLDMNGMPHTGRIRIYSSSSSCQMAARVW